MAALSDVSGVGSGSIITNAERTKISYIDVTQAVDLDTMETNISANNSKVTNATHTGEVTGSTALKGLGMFGNYKSGRTGKALGSISRGLGSLGSRFAGKMRGINPITGRPNTQSQYEANRQAARTQNRIDNMLDRKAKVKNFSEKNLKDLIFAIASFSNLESNMLDISIRYAP